MCVIIMTGYVFLQVVDQNYYYTFCNVFHFSEWVMFLFQSFRRLKFDVVCELHE
jgi:hypothetical protein